MFGAFLDMDKCFDRIWWNGMFFKLNRLGITDKLWLLLRDWYVGSTCSVLTNGSYSVFEISRSIRQGGVISMFMMAVAFCDMHTSVDPGCDNGLAHGNTYLGTPAYADDLAILGVTPQGLQTMLTNVHMYAQTWRISFSATKSKCVTFGETKQENTRNNTKRTFYLGTNVIENVQHIKHVGVELCAYQSAAKRTEDACSRSHSITAGLTSVGFRYGGLNPIVSKNLWNKIAIPSILYGSEVWYKMNRGQMTMMEKMQTRKLKQVQQLTRRTHDYIVLGLLNQPRVESLIHMRKLNFVHKLATSRGTPHRIFLERLYSNLTTKAEHLSGMMGEIIHLLRKYGLLSYLKTYIQGGEFPTRTCWKVIVKEEVIKYDRQWCIETHQVKNDVSRFQRIMGRNLYKKPYSYYTAAMRNHRHRPLVMLAKLLSLPTKETAVSCVLCNNDYYDVTEHIFMYCIYLNDIRNTMWDDMINVLNVELSVELWNKPDHEILDIMLGARWSALRDRSLREEFLDVIVKYTETFNSAIKKNLSWLR